MIARTYIGTWEYISENIKTSAKESLGLYEWKQHKPWFDKECLHFSDQSENIKTSANESLGLYEWKQHKPWFDKECLHFSDQRKRLKCSGYRIQTKAT